MIEESPPPRRADLAGDFGATRFARLLERFWASRDLGTAGTGTAPTGTVQPRTPRPPPSSPPPPTRMEKPNVRDHRQRRTPGRTSDRAASEQPYRLLVDGEEVIKLLGLAHTTFGEEQARPGGAAGGWIISATLGEAVSLWGSRSALPEMCRVS